MRSSWQLLELSEHQYRSRLISLSPVSHVHKRRNSRLRQPRFDRQKTATSSLQSTPSDTPTPGEQVLQVSSSTRTFTSAIGGQAREQSMLNPHVPYSDPNG